MVLAEGRWAWWNQHGVVPLDACVRRTHDTALRGEELPMSLKAQLRYLLG
jgi:hypothetical protein